MMAYELWETQTGNFMASYDDEEQALRAAVERVRRHGTASLESVVLVRVDVDDEEGAVEEIAAGAELLARATALRLTATGA